MKETEGAEDIFDEVYRIWTFSSGRFYGVHFKSAPKGPGRRSEPGKGDIIDVFLMDTKYGETLFSMGMGEDFADCYWPVVLKVKHKACINNAELIKALRDFADSLEADFKNCYYPSADGYIVPNSREEQAILCGLYKNDIELHQTVKWNPGGSLGQIIKMAGWIDPNVSLDTGLGEMLKMGWPELYEKVLEREMSPFEALLETNCVYPKDVYEALTSNAETRKVDEEQLGPAEQVDEVDEADEDLLQELEDL